MRLNVFVSSVLVFMPLNLAAAPRIESGTISFAGGIVEAGCAVETAGALRFHEFRRLQVVPGVEVEVNTYQNACGRGPLPLSATFEPLHASEMDGIPMSNMGIVTVTYR